MKNISVVIPTYNERKRLPKTLEEVDLYLFSNFESCEIIISDGASQDGTQDFVRSFKGRVPLKIIESKKREGKGAGVQKGVIEAEGELVLFMDADNSTHISQLKKLTTFLGEYEIIIGSRYAGREARQKQSLTRRIVSRFGNMLIKIITGLKINDTQCGFKLFTYKAAQDIFPYLQTKGWGFDVEVLSIGQKMGYKIKEVPVVWSDAQGSHLRGVKALLETLSEVMRIRMRAKRLNR